MPINNFLLPGAKFTPAYEVANSCRFNRADTAYMHKTPSSTGNRDVWSWSAWIKRSTLGALQVIFEAGDGGSNYTQIAFNSSDQLDFQDDGGGRLKTNRLFRDVSAWYHLLIVFNSADGTAGDRMRIYVNGTEETSFVTDDTANVAQNEDSEMNLSSRVIRLGYGNEDDYAFGGYMAEVVLLDGTAATPTSFGEFDEDSPTIWKPKDVSGLTFGTNGFYLDFEDSANLGNDKNGGTDLTEVNLAAADQATDTPTNNFATINPLHFGSDNGTVTMSEGNLKFSNSGNDTFRSSTMAVSTGKWYAEFKLTGTATASGVGINSGNQVAYIGSNSYDYIFGFNGIVYNNDSNAGGSFAAPATNDIVGVAVDLDNNKIYWSENGSFLNSGDPTSGATGTGAISVTASSSNGTGFYHFAVGDAGSGTVSFECNFGGCPAFSISSGNADANGYGNFEYAVPSGYYALCTQNLAEFG